MPTSSSISLKASPYQPESVKSQLPSGVTISESIPSTSDGLKDSQKVSPYQSEGVKYPSTNRFLNDKTKEQFLNNPLFQDEKHYEIDPSQPHRPAIVANPNAEKSRQAYIDQLVEKGANRKDLEKIYSDIAENRQKLATASEQANANPQDYNATYNAANALLNLNKPDDAIAMYNATIGNLAKHQGQIQLQNELAMNTTLPQSATPSMFGIGTALAKKGNYEGSMSAYKDALQESQKDENPENMQANIFKGMAYTAFKAGDKKAADKYLLQADQLESGFKGAPFKMPVDNGLPKGLSGQMGVEAKGDIEKQRQADEMSTIADGLEAIIIGNPKAGILANLTPWGFAYNTGKEMLEGVGAGLEKAAQGVEETRSGQEGGGKSGSLKFVSGLSSGAFAAIPQVALINKVLQPINEAAALNPDNKSLQFTADIVSLPFTFISHIAKWAGVEPTTENGKNIAEIADLLFVFGAGHGIKSMAELGELAQKISAGKASEAEIKKINLFQDYVKNLTIGEIKTELKKKETPEAKSILRDIELTNGDVKKIVGDGEKEPLIYTISDNVTRTLDRIDADKPTDPIQVKEAVDYLYSEYNRLKELKSDNNRMFTTQQINDAMAQLGNGLDELINYQNAERNISPQIIELRQQKENLENDKVKMEKENPGSSLIIQPKLDAVTVELTNAHENHIAATVDNVVENTQLSHNKEEIKKLEAQKTGLSPDGVEVIQQQINNLKPKENGTIQESGTSGVLPHTPKGVGETGSENKGMGQGNEGVKITETGKEENVKGIVNTPLSKIFTDTKRFQNREKEFSQGTVDKFKEEGYKEHQMNPILLWKDSKDGKTYVLSGHSRLEAHKQLGMDKIQSKYFEGTEAEAIMEAKKSNTLSTTETNIERAKYYKELRDSGKSHNAIMKEAKLNEGSNATKIIALSYLNPKGKVMDAIRALTGGDVESEAQILKAANWIGDARKHFEYLTDAHETELYDWLINKGALNKIQGKTDFNLRLGKIADAIRMNPGEPLNLEHKITKGSLETEATEARNNIANEIKSLEKERASKVSPPTTERLNEISEHIKTLNKKLGEANAEILKAREADKAQISLFDAVNEVITNNEITDENANGFINNTKPNTERTGFIEDIEGKEKSKENLTDEEIQSELDKIDKVLGEEKQKTSFDKAKDSVDDYRKATRKALDDIFNPKNNNLEGKKFGNTPIEQGLSSDVIKKIADSLFDIADMSIDAAERLKIALEELKPYIEKFTKIEQDNIKKAVSDVFGEKEKIKPKLNKGEKPLKLGERILNSENVSDEIKEGLNNEGVGYIPSNLKVTEKMAKDYVKAFDTVGEFDAAIHNVTDMSNGMSGLNRGAIGKELFETLMDKAEKAKTIEEKEKYKNKAVDIAMFTADNFRKAGDEINAAKAWKRLLERTPEGAIVSIKKQFAKDNATVFDAEKTNIKDAKSVIDDFLKSKEFNDLVGEKVKAELDRLNKNKGKQGNIFNDKKVRDARKDELKAKWKQAKNESVSGSLVGFNKEQMEIAGEMALLHIIDGVAKVGDLAVKLKKDFNDITPEQVNELWNNHKIGEKTIAEYAKEKAAEKFEDKTINDALKIFSGEVQEKIKLKAFKDAVKELNGGEFLDNWNKRLKGLTTEKRRSLLGKAIEEIDKKGGLSDERFKEMYGEELGLKTLSGKEEQKIRGLVDIINKSEKSGKELRDLIDKDASKNEIEAKKKEWLNDVYEGTRANEDLSQYFKHEKKIGNTVGSLMQAGLLGSMTILKNVYGNTLIRPARALSRGVESALDYTLSKASKFDTTKKLSQERTSDAAAYWTGSLKGIPNALKVGVKELIHGVNSEELHERNPNQSLEPLKSMNRFYEGLTGEKKQTAYQQVNNAIESIFGGPAEAVFRLLNLGDKPFRKSAEMGEAYQIGELKGLKGKDLEKFVLFPDAESAKKIKEAGEKSVYQDSNGLTKATQEGLRKMEDYLSDRGVIGDVAKIVFKSQLPYVKTPMNLIKETVRFALPELSLLRGINKSIKGDRKAALGHFSDAVTGVAIRAAAQSLISNNLVTGDGDYNDREATILQNENIQSSSINITGLQRMMSFGDPNPKDGDTWIDWRNMGTAGVLLGVHANQIGIKDEDKSSLWNVAKDLPQVVQTSMDASYLAGVNNFIDAMEDKNGKSLRKWEINTIGTLSSAVYPNMIANVSKASDNTARATKDESFAQELVNNYKVKMFKGDELPSKVNLWGEKIHGAPQGRNKYLWYLLDVTKFKNVSTNTYNYKIFDLWKNAESDKDKRAIIPNIPEDKIIVKNQPIKLSPFLYEEYQIMVGKNRADLVRKYAESSEWEKHNLEIKLKVLGNLYEAGLNNAKHQLFNKHPELIKSLLPKK